MRILFASTPAYGHLLPMLPLAAAAKRAGHEVAVLTHPSMAAADPGVPLLPAGPTVIEALTDVAERTGRNPMEDVEGGAAEFFVVSRLRLGSAEAIEAARGFGPDLIVADQVDYLGRLVAATLDVPWAAHGGTLPLVRPLLEIFDRAADAYGLPVKPAFAYVDPWPDSLLVPSDYFPYERIPVRPDPHIGAEEPWEAPAFPGREDRPTVAVTLGTIADDPATIAAVAASVARLDVNVIVGHQVPETDRVRSVGFVPMRDLLRAADLMVTAAGAGTLLSTLGAGLPSVLLPLGLDKPENAARAAAAGAALVASAPEEIGGLVEKVLADGSFKTSARTLASEIAAMNSPDQALSRLLEQLRA